MDGVIVFFGNATFEEVEHEAAKYGFIEGTVSCGSERFYLWRYTEKAMESEYEAPEIESIKHILGGKIQSAFHIATRHGKNAQFALRVVSALMSKFQVSVLDNDLGNLYLSSRVVACAALFPSEGIYALRSDA